jgi:hypothetical protein
MPTTETEYYEMMQTGAMRRKENYEWMVKADWLHRDAHWSTKQRKLDEKLKNDTKLCHKNVMRLIDKYAVTSDQALFWRASVKGYENGWWGETPPEGAKDPEFKVKPWLLALVVKEYGEGYLTKQAMWDAQAIRKNYDENVAMWVEKPGTEWYASGEEHPQTVEDYYDSDVYKAWKRSEGAVGANAIAQAFADILAPEDRELFSLNRSMNKNIIKEQLKKDREIQEYKIRKVLTKQYYELDSVDELAIALPGIMNPAAKNYVGSREEFATWLLEADNAYQLKKAAAKVTPWKTDYYSDKYEAAKKNYDNTMKRLYNTKIGKFMRPGPAGMILHSYICQPEADKPPDFDYIIKVTKILNSGGKIDYEDIVDDYRAGGRYKNPQRAESATAWGSIITAAIKLRGQIEKERKLDRGEIGDTTEKVAKIIYLYTQAWKRRSRRFKREWDDYGGDDIIQGLWEGG